MVEVIKYKYNFLSRRDWRIWICNWGVCPSCNTQGGIRHDDNEEFWMCLRCRYKFTIDEVEDIYKCPPELRRSHKKAEEVDIGEGVEDEPEEGRQG